MHVFNLWTNETAWKYQNWCFKMLSYITYPFFSISFGVRIWACRQTQNENVLRWNQKSKFLWKTTHPSSCPGCKFTVWCISTFLMIDAIVQIFPMAGVTGPTFPRLWWRAFPSDPEQSHRKSIWFFNWVCNGPLSRLKNLKQWLLIKAIEELLLQPSD